MEQSSRQAQELDQIGWSVWVRDAQTIEISSAMKIIDPEFSITNQTNIADIKRHLHDSEGIPTDQQCIKALYVNLSTFYQSRLTHELADECCVKDIMHCWNTKRFSVWLKLRQPRSHNDQDQS